MRGVADDVRASARDALDEIERALADLRARVPDDVGENLARLGRNLADAVAKVADAARASSRDVRREMRERVREAARELREAIREAAERARERPADEPREHPPGGADRAAGPSERERQILKILEAVRRGEIEPEQADDLIRAWFDARPVTENGNESG
jgi:phosphate uptake regulator